VCTCEAVLCSALSHYYVRHSRFIQPHGLNASLAAHGFASLPIFVVIIAALDRRPMPACI
jgi:hypothetical protein